eukprot:s1570_g3.t2
MYVCRALNFSSENETDVDKAFAFRTAVGGAGGDLEQAQRDEVRREAPVTAAELSRTFENIRARCRLAPGCADCTCDA